jgi:flagellar motor switch protein FliN/FliY
MANKEDLMNAGARKIAMEEYADYLDIPMCVTLEIGRRNLQVREILKLKPGSVVQVMKAAGENIDVYINGKLIAFGEILELDNKAGIRLTDFHVTT